jgi:hypothetical protein
LIKFTSLAGGITFRPTCCQIHPGGEAVAWSKDLSQRGGRLMQRFTAARKPIGARNDRDEKTDQGGFLLTSL